MLFKVAPTCSFHDLLRLLEVYQDILKDSWVNGRIDQKGCQIVWFDECQLTLVTMKDVCTRRT